MPDKFDWLVILGFFFSVIFHAPEEPIEWMGAWISFRVLTQLVFEFGLREKIFGKDLFRVCLPWGSGKVERKEGQCPPSTATP